MSWRIQLILTLTFFTAHGLTNTIEKREIKVQEIPGRSLQSVFGPILILLIIIIEIIVLLSSALISKFSKDNVNITYAINNLNGNARSVRSTSTNYVLDREKASISTDYVLDHDEASISTNYVLDREDTITIQLPDTNTPPNQNRLSYTGSTETIQSLTISRTNSFRTVKPQISRSSIRTIQSQMQSTSRTIQIPSSDDDSILSTQRSLSHTNTVVMIPQSNSLYSYI